MKIKLLIFACLLALGYYYWQNDQPLTHEGEGQIAKEQPVQKTSNAKPFSFGDGYLITPLADFSITARVLSKERYRMDEGAKLVPVDLALGWGPMSDDVVLSKLEISQRNRWFYWRCDSYPIPRDQIEHNAANMHLIPGDDDIEKKIKGVKSGSLVRFSGYLVRADRPDGWKWESSLSRTDTGDHSCELVFVKIFDVIE
jgi:hypothetical protein